MDCDQHLDYLILLILGAICRRYDRTNEEDKSYQHYQTHCSNQSDPSSFEKFFHGSTSFCLKVYPKNYSLAKEQITYIFILSKIQKYVNTPFIHH